ncbi:MAG: L-rhamnose mutarotase [Acidobacteriota bacterium]
MKRFCLALDLKDDPLLIAEYKRHHENVWPEVRTSIVDAGIDELDIYLLGNRLFMVIETDDDFSFETKARADEANPKVQEWERLMWRYQQALPQATNGEKWLLMDRIYSLSGG